jgi:hypothetical protein
LTKFPTSGRANSPLANQNFESKTKQITGGSTGRTAETALIGRATEEFYTPERRRGRGITLMNRDGTEQPPDI